MQTKSILKYLSLILCLMMLQSSLSSQTRPKLIYVGDPMCSWCYGFSPQLGSALNELDEKIELQVVMGGLRPYNKQTMAELKDFLKSHWEEVADVSGQKFNYSILDSENIRYDTEPPSRAILVFRKLLPEKVFAFFTAVQEAFYFQNRNMQDVSAYLDLLESYDIDPVLFRTMFESDEIKQEIRTDFQLSDDLGVGGFPTVFLQYNGKTNLITSGYLETSLLLKRIYKVLEL